MNSKNKEKAQKAFQSSSPDKMKSFIRYEGKNVELLEMAAATDIKDSFYDITTSIQQIEQYIQEVIDVNLNNKQLNMRKEAVSVKQLLCRLRGEVRSLGSNIVLNDLTKKEDALLMDVESFIRAINNIVLHAIERTPQHEQVQIVVQQTHDCIQFVIIDREG